MPTRSDLEYAWLGTKGATGTTIADRRAQVYVPDRLTYWSTLSGLSPAQLFSITDHRRKAYQIALGLTDIQAAALSTADLAVRYWAL